MLEVVVGVTLTALLGGLLVPFVKGHLDRRSERYSSSVALVDTHQITVEPGITITAPRATSRDIRRHKASNYPPPVT